MSESDKLFAKGPEAAAGAGPKPPAPAAAPAAGSVPPAKPSVAGSKAYGSYLYAPKWFPSTTSLFSLSTYLYYGALGVFAIFLLLVVIHFTVYPIFSFSADDDGIIPVPTMSDRQISFKNVIASPDLSANFINIPACGYTVGLDAYITGAFQTSKIPRVLLYRNIDTKVQPSATDTKDNFIARFPATNLILWLDPNLNDLYASVIVKNPSSAEGAALSLVETTPPVENVPQREPFRITVVFTLQLIEIYINGKLRISHPFVNPPNQITATKNYIFPTVPGVQGGVMTSNYTFWPRPLSARETKANGDPMTNSSIFTAPSR